MAGSGRTSPTRSSKLAWMTLVADLQVEQQRLGRELGPKDLDVPCPTGSNDPHEQ